MDTYKIQSGDTLGGIAAANKTTVQELMKLNPSITDANKIFAGTSINLKSSAPAPTVPTNPNPTMTSIPSPTPAPTPTSVPTPPTPQAPAVKDAYFTSATENVTKSRTALEEAYKNQIKDIETKKAEAQKNYDELNDKQSVLLDTNVKPLLEPFREKLENSERERLHVNENFEANQKLVNELDSLLTEGNEILRKQKEEPLALGVLNKKVSKTMDDIAARTGVIEAVLSARSNQITEAYRLIDRSVNAITADRKDQLDYYKTIYDFYEGQKDTEGKKILDLDKDQADYVKAQIGLLEHDLTQAEKSADYIKGLMTDPDSALFIAKAGVTLNDTPEEINKKMAEQAGRDEIKNVKNEMAAKGYEYVPFAKTGDAGVITVDANGQTLHFRNPKAATTGGINGSNYKSDLDAIIGATLSTISTKFGQQTFQNQINRSRNDSDKVSLVAAQVLKNQPSEFKNDFRNQAVGINMIDKAIAELDKGTQTGAINAGAQYLANFAGKDYDPALAKINGYITAAIQPYRNSVTGAAWGEQEDTEYANLFGSIKYSPAELRQRLIQTKELLIAKSVEGLNSFVNPLGVYENPFSFNQNPNIPFKIGDSGTLQSGIKFEILPD